MTRPGPLTRQKRPSWNTTPRSYSRRMRSELATSSASSDEDDRGRWESSRDSLRCVRFGDRAHLQRQAVDARDAHALAGAAAAAGGANLPALALDLGPAFPAGALDHLAGAPIMRWAPLTTGRRRAFAAMPATPMTNAAETSVTARDQRQRNAEARHVAVDQQQRAEGEGGDAADAQRAVARHEGLGDEEGDAQQDQRQRRRS